MTGPAADRPDPDDGRLLALLQDTWAATDPVPDTLAERVLFAVRLEDLDAEVATLVEQTLDLAGARSEESARTVTFSSSSLTATITISDAGPGACRVDGWLAPAEPLRVEVRRTSAPSLEVHADDGGRFVIDDLPVGLVQLVFHPTDGPGGLTTAVAAPPVRL